MSKGLSSVKTLTAKEIANKWNLPLVVVSKKIAAGVKVEKEHTKSTRQANEIARDHLGERPDYYDKLGQMEKKPIVKEESGIAGVRGLGYVTGDPAGSDYVEKYINTNSMAYEDENGNRVDYIKKSHHDLHNKLGFKEFNIKKIKTNTNKDLAESLGSDYGTAASPIVGDLTGAPRKVAKIEEINIKKIADKIPPKAKKAAKVGMTLANLATLGQVAGDAAEGRKGADPKRGIVAATSALPGPVGYGAMAANYTIKGFDAAREHLKSKQKLKEDLRKWFREKWVRYDTKGNIKGPCAREEGEGKPKCRPLASARAMSKDERAKSARRKRRKDPVADRSGKGGKPVMVRTEETLLEKNVPTNPALWARAKSQARAKFDVYPSAYANGWAAKWYKSKGGGWKTAANESIEEACWDTHKQVGMKKKGNRMVPNCVPKEEKNIVPANSTERGIYEDQINEIKAATVGRAVAKAAAERKDITSKKMGKKEIAKWWKRERLVRAGVNKLTGKSKVPASMKEEETKKDIRLMGNQKPDAYGYGAKGTTKTIHEDGMDYDAVVNAVRSKESRNDYGAKSKSSSASGAYQYINKTWKGSASKYDVDTKQYPTAKSAPKEVQDKVFGNDLMKNAQKYGGLDKAVNVHYTGNPAGKVSGAGLKANRGQTGSGYLNDIKKRVDDYNTERKSTMSAAQQMASNFSGGKSLSTPDNTQMAKTIKAPEAPKQVASLPGDDASSFVKKQLKISEEIKMDTKDLINEALDDILENDLVSMKENLMTALQEKAMEKLEERKKIIASEYFAQ